MIVSIWVYFLLGDSQIAGEPPAYVQITASRTVHDYAPERVEEDCWIKFRTDYPHHTACDGGWCLQKVKVNDV